MPSNALRLSIDTYSRVWKVLILVLSAVLLASSCGVYGIGMKDIIPTDEYNALEDLYDETDGDNWTSSFSFLDPEALEWAGVTVSDYEIDGVEVTKVGNVTSLSLRSNNLKGEIPSSIGDLSKLTYLDLSLNELTGEIPDSIGDLDELETLDLSWNLFSGGIPDSIGGLSSLTQLTITDTPLTGAIPAGIGDLSELTRMYLRRNQLTGPLPSSIGDLSKLEWLYLSDNLITGPIPGSFGDLSSLTNLRLQNNKLTGSIPSSLGSLSNVQKVWLQDNQLTGEIPGSLGGMTSLNSLVLHHNQLSGEIPSSLGNLSSLTDLNLGHNQLTGQIPVSLGDITIFRALHLNNNQLTGSIPEVLGSLIGLTYLDLNDNQLAGAIPTSFANLVGLFRLDLFNNNLGESVGSEDWILTREKLIEAGVSEENIRDLPQTTPIYDIIMQWPDGDRLANTTFEINGVTKVTDGSGILNTEFISVDRNEFSPNDSVRLIRNGLIRTYSLGQIDILQAGVNGFYEVNVFSPIIRWPDNADGSLGDPVKNAVFLVNGISRSSDGTGKLDLHDIPAVRDPEYPQDYVYLTEAGSQIPIPFGPIDIDFVSVGFYKVDLCDWANEVLDRFSEYRESFKIWKDLERTMRDLVEVEYTPEKIRDGVWLVKANTPLVELASTIQTIVETSLEGGWIPKLKSLFCSVVYEGPAKVGCELLDAQLGEYVLTTVVKDTMYRITRELTEGTGNAYKTEADAQRAIYNLRSYAFRQWKKVEPRYNQLRQDQPELEELWKELGFAIVFVEGKSGDSSCIPTGKTDVLAFPPPILDPIEEPVIPVIPSSDADHILWITPSVPVILGLDPPGPAFLPETQSDGGIHSFIWTRIQPEGFTIVGQSETYTIPSFTVEDAGEYRRVSLDSLGEVVLVEIFGVYSTDDQIDPPDLASASQILVSFSGSNIAFVPEVLSEAITTFSWQKDGDPLESLNEQVFYLNHSDKSDEGVYSVEITNPGGSVTKDVFELRVIKNALDHIELKSNALNLKIDTESGILYRIEESSDLEVWLDSGFVLTGDDTVHDLSGAGIITFPKFIRIRAEAE